MSSFSRRSFIAGLSAAALFSGTRVLAALPVNPGIVVIGGGVAGMAAAKTLISKGYDAIILEAKNRLGGRAYTDFETFGFPYDPGAANIISADINPLSDLIRSRDFQTVKANDGETWVFLDGKEATEEQYIALDESFRRLSERIDYGSDYYDREGRDGTLRDLSPVASRFDTIAHAAIGPLETGAETGKISIYDTIQQSDTGTEWAVPEGFGNAVTRTLSDGVSVLLSTPVRRVVWHNQSEVTVETDVGNITTKAVVVTVPTNIIAEQVLKFDPPLPPWKMEAAKVMPLSTLDKVAISFAPGTLKDVPSGTYCLIQNGEKAPVWEFLLKPQGREIAIGHIGGKGANLLRQQGARMAFQAALGALISALGPHLKTAAKASHYSNWGGDEWIRGSHSTMKPGLLLARQDLGKPLGQRLYFAGEATSQDWAGQAAGAYYTGVKAAEDIVRWVKI